MIWPEHERAHSWDLDDTLINRGVLVRSVGNLKAIMPHGSYPPRLDNLPVVPREIVDVPPRGVLGWISFIVHANRDVFPGADEVIKDKINEGIDNYGNTGRPNQRLWEVMSRATLDRGGIDGELLKDIFFTPEGVATAVSKAARIAELQTYYQKVEHFDDDVRTAVYLAILFQGVSGVRINLVQHGSSGLLYKSKELDGLSNLRRVGVLGKEVSMEY